MQLKLINNPLILMKLNVVFKKKMKCMFFCIHFTSFVPHRGALSDSLNTGQTLSSDDRVVDPPHRLLELPHHL